MSEFLNNECKPGETENELENKLKLSYKTIADFTYDIEICRDTKGNCVYVNPAFEKTLGYSIEEYISGKITFEDIVHPDDKQIPKKYMDELVTLKEFDDIELRLLKKDGSIIYASLSSQPIVDEQGMFLGRRTSIRDISRRKNAEKSLISSNEKYMSLVNTIGIGVLLIKSDMKISFANPQARKWFKLRNIEKKPLCYEAINISGSKGISPHCPTKKTFIDEKIHQAEFRTLVNNEKKIFKVISTPVRDDNGEVTSVIELIEDITIEKQQQEQLLEAKNQLEEIIDNASELIISFDAHNNVYLWNKTAEQITGYSRNQVMGRSITTLPIFEDSSTIKESLDAIKVGKNVSQTLITFRDEQGRKRLLQLSYSMISGKHIEGVLLVGTDVTEDEEKHGTILPGRGYLIQSQSNKEIFPILRHFIYEDKPGLIISRMKDQQAFIAAGLSNITYLSLTSFNLNDVSDGAGRLSEKVEQYVKRYIQNHPHAVIYFDRIDYLLYNTSFDVTLRLLYRIHEAVFDSDCIFIIRIPPELFPIKQLSGLKEEFYVLPSRDVTSVELEDKLFSILMFIHEKQEANSIVSFKSIKREFSIVDVTVKNRLSTLEEMGLIFIKRKGRMKTIHLTDKGLHLISKRKMA